MFCQHKASAVFVKLADLGVSALVGPTGFHRKPATPGHTAPEAIEYAGTEPLSEKVCKKCHHRLWSQRGIFLPPLQANVM